MPEQQRGQTTSQDFAFQSTDQDHPGVFGGAEGATLDFSARQHHHGFDAHPSTNASLAPTAPTQGSALHRFLSYSDFSASHFPGGDGFDPSASIAWDWANAVDFTHCTPQYEPQGELVQEHHAQHAQHAPTTDFSIPLPVTTTDPVPTAVQNPLSPPPRPSQRLSVQTSMKRKADSEPNSGNAQGPNWQSVEQPSKRQSKSRASSITSATSPVVATTTATATASEPRPPAPLISSMTAPAALENTSQPNSETHKRKEPSKGTGPQGRVIDVSTPRRIAESRAGAEVLPSSKVFPIQIGSELFRLSGASISSDAPSYFSHFFGDQVRSNQGRAGDIRTLYIDRDPDTFRDIALHLQGYHINPRDGEHFVKLFADAQFYSLPRLTKQLFSTDIFIRIGGVPFQIPRDLFSSPGDSPNYFSLGFAQFFSTPTEVFPGLDRHALLRPPSISPPSVPNRNGETFGDLIKMLQGYEVDIRNDAHRSQLLRDARYFHLRGLEQRLIPCETSYNIRRGQSEILIRLDDIRQSGISFTPDAPASSPNSGTGSNPTSQLGVSPTPSSTGASPSPQQNTSPFRPGTISYARPYTDDHAHTNILILELSSDESTTLYFPTSPRNSLSTPPILNLRATFHGTTLARITSLFSVIASKMGLPATQPLGLMLQQTGGGVGAQPVSPANSGVSEHRVLVRLDPDCSLEIDGAPAEVAVDVPTEQIGIRWVGGRRPTGAGNGEPDFASSRNGGEWVWGGARESLGEWKDGKEVEDRIVVRRAHWRIRVEKVRGEEGKMVVVLVGVKIEGSSVEWGRNRGRGFLGG